MFDVTVMLYLNGVAVTLGTGMSKYSIISQVYFLCQGYCFPKYFPQIFPKMFSEFAFFPKIFLRCEIFLGFP